MAHNYKKNGEGSTANEGSEATVHQSQSGGKSIPNKHASVAGAFENVLKVVLKKKG